MKQMLIPERGGLKIRIKKPRQEWRGVYTHEN